MMLMPGGFDDIILKNNFVQELKFFFMEKSCHVSNFEKSFSALQFEVKISVYVEHNLFTWM